MGESAGSVQVLPDELINQIAAGEVVERPASVVKELVENALDAGATRVEVAIHGGGTRFISVTDDGCGLSREDAERAFQRHATSKIASAADLVAVGTLGFRGEALPSIASVSRVRMRTRPAGQRVGTELAGDGSIESVREVACLEGTCIEVADLFARVPARQKFLKAPTTESTQTVRWLERIALARPDLRLSLERDGRDALLFLPTADPRERAIAVLPSSVGEGLLPVEGRGDVASVFGFTTATDVFRGTTSDIHLFVNGRPVRDRFLLHAVRDVYRDALPPGRHPAAVLYLSVEPEEVDVNVHPAKWEVRFREPAAIRRVLRDALVRAIGTSLRTTPSGLREAAVHESAPAWPTAPLERSDALFSTPAPGPAAFALPPSVSSDAPPPVAFAQHRYVGQVLGTYLILERAGALVLLDQHAAHERVLFERLRGSFLEEKLERQALLVPVWIELSRSRADALDASRPALAAAGFELEIGQHSAQGGVRVALRSVPALLAQRTSLDVASMLEETAATLAEPTTQEARDGIEGALHHVFATASCHAAVRAGDRLELAEVQALLESLDATVWAPNCPHGRPIALVLGEAEIERRILRR